MMFSLVCDTKTDKLLVWLCWLMFCSVISPLSADDEKAPDGTQKSAERVVDLDGDDTAAEMRKIHRSAAFRAANNETDTEEFHKTMEILLDTFHDSTVTTGQEPLKWNSVTLNKKGFRFGGIRFRSTLDEPADLYWIASAKPLFNRWYIYPMRGAIEGFQDYRDTQKLTGLELPNQERIIVQKLTGGKIHPGIDYVIWFVMDHEKPVDFKYALRLMPKEPEIKNGLRDTPEGLLEKLQPLQR